MAKKKENQFRDEIIVGMDRAPSRDWLDRYEHVIPENGTQYDDDYTKYALYKLVGEVVVKTTTEIVPVKKASSKKKSTKKVA